MNKAKITTFNLIIIGLLVAFPPTSLAQTEIENSIRIESNTGGNSSDDAQVQTGDTDIDVRIENQADGESSYFRLEQNNQEVDIETDQGSQSLTLEPDQNLQIIQIDDQTKIKLVNQQAEVQNLELEPETIEVSSETSSSSKISATARYKLGPFWISFPVESRFETTGAGTSRMSGWTPKSFWVNWFVKLGLIRI